MSQAFESGIIFLALVIGVMLGFAINEFGGDCIPQSGLDHICTEIFDQNMTYVEKNIRNEFHCTSDEKMVFEYG